MTTSLNRSSISAIPDDGKPTQDQIIFFARRFKNELHAEVLRRFIEAGRAQNLTKAELARRLDKDPAQINRWLAAPKNLETETISALLLAMGYLPRVESVKLADLSRGSNHFDSKDILDCDKSPKGPGKFASAKPGTGTRARFDEPMQVVP